MRIYDTCHPEKAPTEFKVSASIADGITKLCWSTTEEGVVIIGKKSGDVEKWDTRSGEMKPVQSASVPGGDTVMDFELNNNHGIIMVASGKKVRVAVFVMCKFMLLSSHFFLTISGLFVRHFVDGSADGARHAVAPDLQGGGRRLVAPRRHQIHRGEELCSYSVFSVGVPMACDSSVHRKYISSDIVFLCFSCFILQGGSDLWLREYDYASGEVLRTFKGHHGPIRCVRYHPSGNVGASGSEDGTIRLWDLGTVPSTA